MADNANLSLTSRVSTATIDKVLKKVTEPLMQKRIVLAMLLKKGKVLYNQSGKQLEWKVRYIRNDGEDFDDLDGTTIERVDRHKTALLGWGGVQMSEGISDIEREINKGKEATFSLIGGLIDWMKEDLVISLEDRLIQGTDFASTTKIYGFENWLGENAVIGSSIGWSPSDTYAGLVTNHENYGGSATTYPDGTVSEEAVFWSPQLVDYTSTNATADTKEWKYTFEEAMRFGVAAMEAMQSTTPDVFIMTPAMIRDAKQALDSRGNMQIDRGTSDNLVAKLGFGKLWVDGIPFESSVGVPSGTAYGIDFDHLELRSLRKQLFTERTQEDLTVHSKFFNLCFLGQLKIDSPAYFIKLKDFT